MTELLDTIRSVPKVTLHDHLDGGLRPQTVMELASEAGVALPAVEPEALADWFFAAADSGSLGRYLETFAFTTAVMQTRDALHRVAREFVQDMAADGVVYAETRWAPEQHLTSGLTLDAAVEAVHDGLAEGMDLVAAEGTPVVARQILASMRQSEPDARIARLVVAWRDRGVVGFDLAGPESGFPASRYRDAIQLVRNGGSHVTVHAGEAEGAESIRDALEAGAERLGHGVRIVEDVDGIILGPVARSVLTRRVPLEICPTSNLQTGIAATLAEHPMGHLLALGFAVTVSCDNRLVSRTSLSRELTLACGAFGLGIGAVHRMTVDAMRSAFCPQELRESMVADIIDPGFEPFL